jgi:hypothetical protein
MMYTKSTTTTIRVNHKTKDKLNNIGRKNQSYDSIVLSLLDRYHSGLGESK